MGCCGVDEPVVVNVVLIVSLFVEFVESLRIFELLLLLQSLLLELLLLVVVWWSLEPVFNELFRLRFVGRLSDWRPQLVVDDDDVLIITLLLLNSWLNDGSASILFFSN